MEVIIKKGNRWVNKLRLRLRQIIEKEFLPSSFLLMFQKSCLLEVSPLLPLPLTLPLTPLDLGL